MKKLLITFGALIILTSCGYSSEDECRLKEMQKCDSTSCENQAYLYCSDEFRGDSWFSILMDWILTIGYWGFIVAYGVIFILGLVMAFGSEPEERKHGGVLVFVLTAPLALAILIAFIVNNFL